MSAWFQTTNQQILPWKTCCDYLGFVRWRVGFPKILFKVGSPISKSIIMLNGFVLKKTIKFVVVSVSIICWGQSLPKIKHFCALQPLQAAWIRSTPPVSTLAEAAIWAVATGKTKGSNVVKANAIPLSFGDGLDTCRPPISGLSLSMVAALGLPFTAI
jgi:hypothetical protein